MTNTLAGPARLAVTYIFAVVSAVLVSSGRTAPRSEKPLAPLPREAPAPEENPTTPAKVALGKQLFFDPRLSGDNTMSCATCHLPEKALADGLPLGKGRGGKSLARNTPSLLNTGFYDSYFWDGRAKSLEEQALGPIESPDEMNQDLDELEAELNAVPGYVEQFQEVFGEKPNREGIAKALAAFQRTLITGPSPFDRYLAGEKDALSYSAKRGLELFTGEADCVRCHRGPTLSDGKFYRLGVASDDEGRGAVTGEDEDRKKFRTPSLRNVAETGPYMHNGSLKTLTQVVEFYYRGVPSTTPDGLPLDIEPLVGQSFSDITELVAFLESLTGKPPEITPPELP
jgi:cytochrome c peroxidase